MTEQELPGFLADIAEVCGREAALKVAAAKGGTRAYFPSEARLHAAHWLVAAVGMDDAKTICRELFGARLGGSVEIPLASASRRHRVWTEIRRMLDEGCSSAAIARALEVNEKTVRRHRNGQTQGAAAIAR
jgi:DNA-binding NarL/FixJ family response regulator